MPSTAEVVHPTVRHEEFCLPREGLSEPRIETYPYLADNPDGGRSVHTHNVTRCIECGAATYRKTGA